MLRTYLVHPQTKEMVEEENFTMFKDWKSTTLEEMQAEEVVEENNAYLKDENGNTIAEMSIESFFNGSRFIKK